MEKGYVPRPKKLWPDHIHEYFINVCVQEIQKGNRPGTSFNRAGWRNILTSLNAKPHFNIDRKQLKSHWDQTRGKWKAWCKLIGTSSMKWDPETKQFGASPHDWDEYVKFNPDGAVFRYQELEFIDKLEFIFPRITPDTVTGVTEPPSQRRKLDNGPSTSLVSVEEEESDELDSETDEQLKFLPQRAEQGEDAVVSKQIDVLPERIEHRFEPVELRPKEPNPRRVENFFEPVVLSKGDTPTQMKGAVLCNGTESRARDVQRNRIGQRQCDAVESGSDVTNNIPSQGGERSYSIGECIECLDGMEEVEQGGELYLFALDVFLRKEYREIFLQLKKPSVKISWLKRLQSVGALSKNPVMLVRRE